ncbi:MAG: T9SS type A sorting domain-containing protein [bacterium]
MRFFISIIYAFFFLACYCYAQQDNIIFIEDFEESTLQQMSGKWEEAVNLNGMSFSSDVPPESIGKKSLMMTYEAENNTGGHLYKMFPQGFDSLYARFYVKFAQTHHPVHHFVHLGGYNPPTRWPQGGAGSKPIGNERFSTGIEPMGSNWRWDFYSYWMHMRGNPQVGTYWGNDFNPVPPELVIRGEWICVELMMKINNPVSSISGEQAFWINGNKIHHLGQGFPYGYWIWDSFHPNNDSLPFEGFQWRNDENLKLNFFWLLYYMTGGTTGQRDTVWFDDVVVSNNYNGPIITETKEYFSNSRFLSCFPNPLINTTEIQYTIEKPTRITLSISNNLGIEVKRLIDNVFIEQGINKITFDTGEFSSGVYFCTLKGGNYIETQKFLISK